MAQDDLIALPTTCPICRRETLSEFRRSDVVSALLNDRPIRLNAPCCGKSWTVGYVEMQRIRAYLGVGRLEPANSGRLAKPPKLLED